MILGGYQNKVIDTIYYATSIDFKQKQKNNEKSIWHISECKLPCTIRKTNAIFTDIYTIQPKLHIIAGYVNHRESNVHYSIQLSQIIPQNIVYSLFFRVLFDLCIYLQGA